MYLVNYYNYIKTHDVIAKNTISQLAEVLKQSVNYEASVRLIALL